MNRSCCFHGSILNDSSPNNGHTNQHTHTHTHTMYRNAGQHIIQSKIRFNHQHLFWTTNQRWRAPTCFAVFTYKYCTNLNFHHFSINHCGFLSLDTVHTREISFSENRGPEDTGLSWRWRRINGIWHSKHATTSRTCTHRRPSWKSALSSVVHVFPSPTWMCLLYFIIFIVIWASQCNQEVSSLCSLSCFSCLAPSVSLRLPRSICASLSLCLPSSLFI